MRLARAAVVLLLVTPVAACALTQGYYEHDDQARALLASVNWDAAAVIKITLDDFSFEPQDIVLQRNRPTVLRLRNVGTQPHDMSGGTFFQVALIKQIATAAGKVVTPYIQSVHVRPKQQVEVWLLPVRSGRFGFQCSIPGHREQGMHGQVTVR